MIYKNYKKEASLVGSLIKESAYGDYPHNKIPEEFSNTKAVQVLQEHNYDMDLIELFQEMGYPPAALTEDDLTRKNFDYSYDKIDEELGGFGRYFYVRPEKDSYGRVMLTDEGFEAVKNSSGEWDEHQNLNQEIFGDNTI